MAVVVEGLGDRTWQVPELQPGQMITIVNDTSGWVSPVEQAGSQWVNCYRPTIRSGDARTFVGLSGRRVALVRR